MKFSIDNVSIESQHVSRDNRYMFSFDNGSFTLRDSSSRYDLKHYLAIASQDKNTRETTIFKIVKVLFATMCNFEVFDLKGLQELYDREKSITISDKVSEVMVVKKWFESSTVYPTSSRWVSFLQQHWHDSVLDHEINDYHNVLKNYSCLRMESYRVFHKIMIIKKKGRAHFIDTKHDMSFSLGLDATVYNLSVTDIVDSYIDSEQDIRDITFIIDTYRELVKQRKLLNGIMISTATLGEMLELLRERNGLYINENDN